MVTDIQQAASADIQEKIAETHELLRLERDERNAERRHEYTRRIGQNLSDFQATLRHKFIMFLQSEFRMSLEKAQEYMRTAIRKDEPGVISPNGAEYALVRWDRLRQDVAEASSIDELKDIRDKAEALRLYAKKQKTSLDIQNNAAEVTLRCTRRIGEMLQEIIPHDGGRPSEKQSHHATVSPPRLEDIGITKSDSSRCQTIARVPEETFEQHIAETKVKREELTQAGLIQLAKREQAKEYIADLKVKGVNLPTGKYSCLVVDPPWTMQKIERDVRPNQVEFDYPTMTEDELRNFPLPDYTTNDCHLYLWTTQKHLPLALRLAEHWGFKYQCLMTWVKNVGFTPFSWMYSTEHVLFCTKGSLPLLEIGRRLDFRGKVRDHSRKPDEFYDIVREVSPGPRLDVFSREKRDGFEQYGNEVEKYV